MRRRILGRSLVVAMVMSLVAVSQPAHAYSQSPPYDSATSSASGTLLNLYGGTDWEAQARKSDGYFNVHTWSRSDYPYAASLFYVGVAYGYASANASFVHSRNRDIFGMEAGTYYVTAGLDLNSALPHADASTSPEQGYYSYAYSEVYAQMYVYSYSCKYNYNGYSCTSSTSPTVKQYISCSNKADATCATKRYLTLDASVVCPDQCQYVQAYVSIYASATSAYSGAEAVGSASGYVDSIQIKNAWGY